MHESKVILDPQEAGYLADGKPAFGTRFKKAMSFHYPEGLAAVTDETGAYHIGLDGQALYAQRYRETFGFYCGLATVRDNSGYFHIDTTGSLTHKTNFKWAGNYQEGLCAVMTADGYCHVDVNGEPVYGQRYLYVGDFRYGIAVAHSAAGAFHIRTDGSRLNTTVHCDADPFHKGYAVVSDDTGYYHVDKEGQPAHPYRYKKAEPFYNGISRCLTHDGRQLLLRENGFYTYVSQSNARIDIGEIPSLIRNGCRVALYIRHAERFPRPSGQWGDDLQLTVQGIADAKDFGKRLRNCRDCSFHSSPVLRCQQTALSIAAGIFGHEVAPALLTINNYLGSPGPFNDTKHPAQFLPDEFSAVADSYLDSGFHSGLLPLSQCCEGIADYLRSSASKPFNIFATHDFFVAGLERFLGLRHPKHGDWVRFLEGVCLIEDGSTHGKWAILEGSREQKTC